MQLAREERRDACRCKLTPWGKFVLAETTTPVLHRCLFSLKGCIAKSGKGYRLAMQVLSVASFRTTKIATKRGGVGEFCNFIGGMKEKEKEKKNTKRKKERGIEIDR